VLGGDPGQTPPAATPRTPSPPHSTISRRRSPDPPPSCTSLARKVAGLTSLHILTNPSHTHPPLEWIFERERERERESFLQEDQEED